MKGFASLAQVKIVDSARALPVVGAVIGRGRLGAVTNWAASRDSISEDRRRTVFSKGRVCAVPVRGEEAPAGRSSSNS